MPSHQPSAGGANARCVGSRVLIVHEQHLQQMGSDSRLLALIRALVRARQNVSLFFRSHTPEVRRSPPTEELARLLHIDHGYSEADLRRDVRSLPPPAIYERTTSAQVAQLFSQGWFNAVIFFFWFWHDPKPNVVELTLPHLHAFSPPGARPFAAILSDDAHGLRDKRLAGWEEHPGLRENYSARAVLHVQRQRHIYPLADMLLHLTKADSDAERPLFPSVERWGLLRLPLREIGEELATEVAAAGTALANSTVLSAPLSPHAVLRIGFLGNGQTPTNHLAVGWFLNHCWGAIRQRHPNLRLRLIGLPPGHRTAADGGLISCDPLIDLHCGWAWATPYIGREAEQGIDTLGFLPREAMVRELLSWRCMVVPVLQTTGINTKVYTALALGVPLVITPVAAAPFDFPGNHTAALMAADASAFQAAVLHVVASDEAWGQLSRASSNHWKHLLREDQAEADVRVLIGELCSHTHGGSGFMSGSKLSPVVLSWGEERGADVTSVPERPKERRNSSVAAKALCSVRPPSAPPPLLAPSNGSRILPVLIASHSVGGDRSFAKRLVSAVWRVVCNACWLPCYLPSATLREIEIPPSSRLAVVHLGRQHVLDVDAVSLEQHSQPDNDGFSAAPRQRGRLQPSHVHVAQWLHFIVSFGPEEAMDADAEALGASATRLMLPPDPKATLKLPPITSLCQDRAIWRAAFRFVGLPNEALPYVWHRLATDLPQLFRCNFSPNFPHIKQMHIPQNGGGFRPGLPEP